MSIARDILENYRRYLIATFGRDAWVYEAQMSSNFYAADAGDCIIVRASGSDSALAGIAKACELYANHIEKVVVFNNLAYQPDAFYADLAA